MLSLYPLFMLFFFSTFLLIQAALNVSKALKLIEGKDQDKPIG